MSLIKLSHLTKIYKSNENVAIGIQDVNLEFDYGEFVAIVGSSGSGKTTLLNVVSGMDTYEEGELFLSNKSTSNFSSEDFETYRRANVAFIFQNYQLVDSYTVLENVMVELIFKGFTKKDAKQKAKEILTKVGLKHRLHNRATKLSGGEKQRVVIARAIASNAKILVCDEPTGNLDSKTSKEIMALLKEISVDKLVLFVTHDESLIENNATRIVRIKDGKVESDTKIEKNEAPKNDVLLDTTSKNKLSTQAYIAFKNIVRTPKKSGFVYIVFMIMCFVLMCSIAYLPTTIQSYDVSVVEYKTFENPDKNRLVVYDEKVSENVPENALVVENDYVIDMTYVLGTNNPNLNVFLKDKAYLKASMDFIDIIAGEAPQAQDEMLLILNDEFSNNYLNDAIGAKTKIRLYAKTHYFETDYVITGIGTYSEEFIEMSKNIYSSKSKKESVADVLYADNHFHLSPLGIQGLANSIKYIETQEMLSLCLNEMVVVEGDKNYKPELLNTVSNKVIRISYRFKDKDFKLKIGVVEVDLTKYQQYITYEFTVITDFAIGLSTSMAQKIFEEHFYRYSVYVPYNEIDNTHALLSNETNKVYAMKNLSKVTNVYSLKGILENLLYIVFIVVEILVSLFIVTLITSFVLGTKKKELGVLRVIGLSEKDVLRVLHFELFFLMGLAIISSIIIALISPLFNIDFTFIFDNKVKLIVSIIILIVMAYMISFSWNKKMFKKSAREVLKVGDAL